MVRQLSGLFSNALAGWFDAKGMSVLADTCYRHAAAGAGRSAADAAFMLGKRLLDRDENRKAEEVLELAVRRAPRHARAWCALGAARRRLAKMDEAREATERALALDARCAQARCNLGEWHLMKGDAEAALNHFEQALADDPNLIEAVNNRVAALYELSRFEEAEAAARIAIERYPTMAGLHVNIGNVLLHTGKAREAIKAFQRALEIDPISPEARINLSMFFGETHYLGEAFAFIEHQIAIHGENAQRLAALALAQQARGDHAAAEATCRKVLGIQPDSISALITLAGCLSARGDHREAIACHEKALSVNPRMSAIASNIAFSATYLPGRSSAETFDLHYRWAQAFEEPLVEKRYRHSEAGRDPGKRLRIGYVSGDFGYHPVGFLIRDVLRHHDRQAFEIHCFSMMRKDDDITVEIRSLTDGWHDILFDSDEEVAQKIYAAGMDIAVDLSGHTAYHRLLAFAMKPAPVQATWIGYFHSTGLSAIDYFITDPYTTPQGSGQLFSETPLWLPHSRFCYSPPDYAGAAVPPPLLGVGYVTFGSFNRAEKIGDEVVTLWAEILKGVPDSRLLLKAAGLDNEAAGARMRAQFVACGVAPERILLRGRSSHLEMLREYGEIDIALDTFPFNGGMTTLEALWMGVPVVTIAGEGVVSRQTLAALANIGLTELAFPDAAAYVEGAIALANDGKRLAALRREIRPRMAASPLRQSEKFSRDLEDLYRRMWEAWCRGERLPSNIGV